MIWSERSPAIVMITKLVESGKAKCESYLPPSSASSSTRYGDIKVSVESIEETAGCSVRHLLLEVFNYNNGTQFHQLIIKLLIGDSVMTEERKKEFIGCCIIGTRIGRIIRHPTTRGRSSTWRQRLNRCVEGKVPYCYLPRPPVKSLFASLPPFDYYQIKNL